MGLAVALATWYNSKECFRGWKPLSFEQNSRVYSIFTEGKQKCIIENRKSGRKIYSCRFTEADTLKGGSAF